MTNHELSELIALFDRSTALTMKLTDGSFSLELDRRGTPSAPPAAAPMPAPAMSANAPTAPAAEEGKWIKAPIVGTFYAASAPDQPPFVQPGSRVKAGDILCLMEAMKMMSEVNAPCDLVVEEIAAENGALLSYDAPILRYREV